MIKSIFIIIVVSLMLNLTLVAQENINSTKIDSISWTDEYHPAKSKFFVHNEIEINASANTVWEILIDATKWESWYHGAKNVKLEDRDLVLRVNSVFTWKTMGMKFQSSIKQYETNNVLAWETRKKSVQSYTVWLIIPTDNGCKVILDESQNGWLTTLEKMLQRNKLRKLHDHWLTSLKKQSEEKNQTTQL